MPTSLVFLKCMEQSVKTSFATISSAGHLGEQGWQGGRISSAIRCVKATNSNALTATGTNTWIVSSLSGHCVIIDPGPYDSCHIEAIFKACAEDNLHIQAILITHDHADHAEAALPCALRANVSVLGKRSQTLFEGSLKLGSENLRLEVVSLPGHSSDSVGFLFPDYAVCATGDFLFHEHSTAICWPDGGLYHYFKSLEKLRYLVAIRGIKTLLPGHGQAIFDPFNDINRQKSHRCLRLQSVLEAVKNTQGDDVKSIVKEVYGTLNADLEQAASMTIQAQISYLKERNMI